MKKVELEAWCSLWRASGVGSVRFRTIIEALGSPRAFFTASDAQLRKALSGIPESQWQRWRKDAGQADADLDWLAGGDDRHIVTWHDDTYPPQLRHIPDPPPLLFVRGNVDVLQAPQLAVVGSRQADRIALQHSYDFAKKLAAAGMVITSGLALGIDGSAHQGALDGGGQTVAVVATGLDRVYPARHHQLATQIVTHGAVVSEMPVGTGVRSHLFPRRNRIISGLALGVLVVQASIRSGSLITARQALEQGREVFAIPGSIHDPLSRGCHALIKSGAALVEDMADIIAVLRDLNGVSQIPSTSTLEKNTNTATIEPASEVSGDAAVVLAAMGFDPCTIDRLDECLELTNAEISAILLELELDGYVTRLSGGRYQRLS